MAMSREARGRALVVGLGLTGLSCARYLVGRGYHVTVVDSRDNPPCLSELRATLGEVDCYTGSWNALLFKDPGMLVVSPGVSVKEPLIAQAIREGVPAVGDVELFARVVVAPTIAVTGVNGKSTVTAMVGAICKEAGLNTLIGGNIGVPVLSLLEKSRPDVYVLELSSFQLETTYTLNARVATVLNVSRDHMDRYGSLDDYAAAKARIFGGDGVMVLNADDPAVMGMADPNRRAICFGLGQPSSPNDFGIVHRKGEEWLARGDDIWMPAAAVPLQGRHNLANALAAMALASTIDVTSEPMQRAVTAFRGLPHRSQIVTEKNNIVWINDSKATNVGAMLAALKGITRPVVLIAGGDAKGADFRLLKNIVKGRARAVVLIGRDAGLIEATLEKVVPIAHATDMHDAVEQAGRFARAGDAVLLSPGCASFDMFDDYVHRGEVFTAAVRDSFPGRAP